jgi:polyribonucleotide nucleotidyltransferase
MTESGTEINIECDGTVSIDASKQEDLARAID